MPCMSCMVTKQIQEDLWKNFSVVIGALRHSG